MSDTTAERNDAIGGGLAAILQRPRTVLTLMAVMIVFGVLAYINIPKEAQPDIDVPIYVVTVTQQGISPRDSERLLVRPLETKLRGLEGLKEITTTAYQNAAVALLEFEIETDADQVLADLRDKVDQAKAEFPAEADEPTIQETNTALQPTIIVTLSGTAPERTLYRFARQLEDEIEAIDSVREAEINGDRDELLEVEIDLTALESYDITQSELLNALQQGNQLVPAGAIDSGAGRFNLKVPGLVESAADVFSIPIKQNEEAVVTLGDVASIRRTFKDPTTFTRVNGKPAVSLNVTKRIGTNIIENNDAVRERVEAVSKDWPSTVKVGFMLDESDFINEVSSSLQSSILTAIALVMIVVVASLGLRSGLLVGLSVPLSFTIGFLILSSFGWTVNMMVLFGLVLTVGMLVDGAIVVTEYADRKLSEGLEPKRAYIEAAQLMFWPVVSSTLTTLAAFLPLLLWPGVAGEFMSYLPTMVIIVLTASLLTALIFLPTAGYNFPLVIGVVVGLVAAVPGYFYGNRLGEILPAIPPAALAYIGAALAFGVAMFLANRLAKWDEGNRQRKSRAEAERLALLSSDRRMDEGKLGGFTGGYVRVLRLLTGNLLGNAVVVVGILVGAFGIVTYFSANTQGVEFFVDEEPDVASVLVSARGNLSPGQVRDIVDEVGNVVMSVPGVDNVVMTAKTPGASSGGNPFGAGGDRPADVIGEIQLELVDYENRRSGEDIFADIRAGTAGIAGVKLEIAEKEGGPPTGKDVQIEINGSNYDQVDAATKAVRTKFEGTADLLEIEDTRPLPGIEWELKVNREEAGRYNASIPQIGAMIQLVTDGVLIDKFQPDDTTEEVEIRARLPKDQRTFETLDNLNVRTPNGQVPLANFVTRTPVDQVASIKRRDGLYSMRVKANVDQSKVVTEDGNTRNLTPGDKVTELQAWLDQQDWPSGLSVRFRGADEEQQKSQAFLQQAGGIALFLMFIILLTQFNSFYQTVLTLSTVVLAVFGVLLGLAVMGQKFSIIMTGTGVVALAGIVVNNAIVLIDTFNRLRSEGVDTRDAVLKTAAQRLRPIMLTTTTTILGLLPMMYQVNLNFITRDVVLGGITSTWWVQLSTAIIFGLSVATVLTLVLIPTMLALPANVARFFKAMGDTKLEGRIDPARGLQAAGVARRIEGFVTDARALPAVAHASGIASMFDEARKAEPEEPVLTGPMVPFDASPDPVAALDDQVAMPERIAILEPANEDDPAVPFRDAAE